MNVLLNIFQQSLYSTYSNQDMKIIFFIYNIHITITFFTKLHLFLRNYLIILFLESLLTFVLFKLALPNCDDCPTHIFKLFLVLFLSFPVSVELVFPIFNIRIWNLVILASFMEIPEAATDKDYGSVFRQHNIRTSRISPVILS